MSPLTDPHCAARSHPSLLAVLPSVVPLRLHLPARVPWSDAAALAAARDVDRLRVRLHIALRNPAIRQLVAELLLAAGSRDARAFRRLVGAINESCCLEAERRGHAWIPYTPLKPVSVG